MAASVSSTSLIIEVRERPLGVRDAVAESLRRGDLGAAVKIADAYAAAWRDSFFVREVARFAAWPPQRRETKLWVDSVRGVGISAFSRDGPRAAVVVWRRALARARINNDSAAIAALLGNIGAGLLEESETDSATAYLEAARGLAGVIGDRRVEANAVGALAGVAEDRGDLAGARDKYATSLMLRDRIGDTRGAAADHNNLGLLAQRLGDLDEAHRQFDTALGINRLDGRDEVAATNLVNLAGLASVNGDFARATVLYREALATWRAHEDWADAGSALYGLGQVELRRGDYRAAETTLREALKIYAQTGPIAAELAVRSNLAGALGAMGDLQGARDELNRAQRRADTTRAPPQARAEIALARADLAVQLNTLADAQRLYARAELLYRQAGEPIGEAEAQQGRAALLLARDDAIHAQPLIESALREEIDAENWRAAALARVTLAQTLAARGDTSGARSEFVRAAGELRQRGDPVAGAAALGSRADMEARSAPSLADSLYRAGLDQLAGRVAPEISWRLHVGLGEVLRSHGDFDAAARELRSARRDIEGSTRSLVLAERRSVYLTDKWAVYAALAILEHDRGHPAAAFEASEQLRSRQMLEQLARGRVATSSDSAGELVVREQDLRRRIAELTRDVEGDGDAATRDPDATPIGSATLARAQDAYADLLLEIRERAPRHAELVVPAVAQWQSVARRLADNQALIEYLITDSAALAFVVRADTIAAIDLATRRSDLTPLIEFTRGTVTSRRAAVDSLWRAPLRQLYTRLIAPIEDAGLLAGVTRLVLVPQAELNYLPFAALVDPSNRFLVEHYELTETPSASVWLELGERRRREASGGLLAFAPNPASLPASRQEVATIQRVAGARVLIGSTATEDAFRREAPAQRVLHLAGYGVLNKANPLFSYVQLASSGEFDGRLEVREVLTLDLTADLVVLSACQTGLGSGALADVPAGDDWIGLTRAFLHAGAANVVATLWPVDDWGTASLMEEFYKRYAASADPAAALANAQRALIAGGPTAHPFYWAGFVSTGGAGAGAPQ